VAPEPNRGGGWLKNWFGKGQTDSQEHPMSENMAASLNEQLAKNPSMATAKGERGWTLLHQQALAGSAATVKVLLAAGADPRAVTDDGTTPTDLAKSLGWDKVEALLASR
jgi:ankyrin repeat protein